MFDYLDYKNRIPLNKCTLGKIPKLNPYSQRYKNTWKDYKRKIIEGYWVEHNGEYKWLPPVLALYNNFWTIEMSHKGSKSQNKTKGTPRLRDLEWIKGFVWAVIRGFSGFEKDDIYSSNKILIAENKDELISYASEHVISSIYNSKGELKEYVDALEYLYRYFKSNLGKPQFYNPALNVPDVEARNMGKSFIGACMVAHNFLTDGSMDYDELIGLRSIGMESMSETLVSAIDSKYSTGLINKIKLGLDSLPGSVEIGSDVWPSPLYKKYTGSFMSGKHIEAGYDKKSGNNWIRVGSKSRILHRSFGDNPFAANGTRPGFTVIDEIGFMGNLLEALGQLAECTTTDGRKFGSIWMTGCVCAGTKVWNKDGNLVNIEDLKIEDGIYGYNKVYGISASNSINFLKEPSIKNCYRITTNSLRTLECSEDHPILWSRKDFGSNNRIPKTDKRLFYKNTTYVETKDIRIGDQVAVIEDINKFSDNKLWEARLVGMLIGDGSYGFNKTPILSSCDIEINEYIDRKYDTVIEKSYITKDNKIYRETRIKGICKDLRTLGIYGQSKDSKTLPIDIHSYSKRSICELVAGLFDTDGCIYINKSNTKGNIQFSTAYLNLANEVRLLLQKIGIHCTINYSKPNLKNPKDKNGYYKLIISDARSIVNFYESIPLIINYKIEKLNNLYHIYKDAPIRKSKNVNGIRFERVINIEHIGEKEVYNLNAALTHSYIANGIVTHNTGGDMASGATEAIKKVFYDPSAYDCMSFDDIFENKGKIGFFVPAWMALDEFRDELGNVNKELALRKLLREREIAANAKSKAPLYALLQMKPLVPSEAFLVLQGNIFPVGELKEHLASLESTERKKDLGTTGWMFRDKDGKSEFKPDHQLTAADYPTKESDNSNGAVVIWELPTEKISYGQYVAGIDPYDQDKANNSVSYGSVFIYKRFVNADQTYNLPVAEYTGRPEFANDFYEQCRRLCEFYQCKALYENQNTGLKQYFQTRHCLELLHVQPNIVKSISPNSKVERGYGIHMSKQIKDELEIKVRDWLKEETSPGILQLTKIYSIPLLKELIAYNTDGNFDRFISFALCVLQSLELHNITMADTQEVDEVDSFFQRKLFSNSRHIPLLK